MFKQKFSILVIILSIFLFSSGCGSNNNFSALVSELETTDGTKEVILQPTSIKVEATSIATGTFSSVTKTHLPLNTVTKTPPPTLPPDKARAEILRLIREESGLPTPNLLGIVPGKTPIGVAKDLFNRLGMPLESPVSLFPRATLSPRERNHYSNHWQINNVFFLTIFFEQESLIKNIEVRMNFQECMRLGQECDRSLYSPAYFIEMYGNPTKVTFSIGTIYDFEVVDGATPTPEYPENYAWYYMTMNYDPLNLIVSYNGAGFIDEPGLTICPLSDPFESVWIWMGKDPENLPYEGAPLEKATSLTIEQFTGLLLNKDTLACFPLNVDVVLTYQ